MNLSTARSAGRAKEIGLRKVVGAKKKIGHVGRTCDPGPARYSKLFETFTVEN